MKADDIIRIELARINSHLPKARVRLDELMRMEEPHVVLRDGSSHFFRREELELLSKLVDEEDVLRLPIVLEVSGEKFRVRGRVEVKVMDRLLGLYDPLDDSAERTYHRYLLSRVRRLLPTATTVAFTDFNV